MAKCDLHTQMLEGEQLSFPAVCPMQVLTPDTNAKVLLMSGSRRPSRFLTGDISNSIERRCVSWTCHHLVRVLWWKAATRDLAVSVGPSRSQWASSRAVSVE